MTRPTCDTISQIRQPLLKCFVTTCTVIFTFYHDRHYDPRNNLPLFPIVALCYWYRWKSGSMRQGNMICVLGKSKSKGLPQQAEVAQGVPGRLRPRIFLTFRHYKGGRSSAKRTVRLYPGRNPWYSLSETESTSGHMVLSEVPRKKPPVTTGNRSRDPPTSSAVP